MKQLMELLVQYSNLEYISNLRERRRFCEINKALKKVFPDDFDISEWNDAASYISGEPHSFESAAAALSFLLALTSGYGK
ncbi:MAG: hypothetical protein RSE36_02830 [Oscillospiraceae bacterium]